MMNSNTYTGAGASQNKNVASLQVKYELFDHLIYPLTIKIDDNSIIQLFRKLHIMSSIDYKITYKEWLEQSTSNLIGFTEKEAKILFMTYKIFANELEQSKNTNVNNSRYDINSNPNSSNSSNSSNTNSIKNSDTVDVRYFGLFFSLQLFNQRSKLNNIDTRDKNPYNANNFNNYSSPLSSPRGKGSSSARGGANQEYQMILNFIKSNLKLFLRLIASDIHNTETSLNSNEFNTLKFFFKIPNTANNNTGGNTSTNSLSTFAPFFVNFSTTTKINIEIINEWLSNMIYSFPNNNLTTSFSAVEIEDMVSLKNLSKCLTIKENLSNKNLKISQCEDSFIYINSNVNSAKISNCFNCTIVVASVSKIASIDKCENCTVSIATNLLRVSNTIDSTVFSYSINEPILFGDNRALIMAPHNVYYTELLAHLKEAKFPSINATYMNNFMSPVTMHALEGENLNYSIMSPKDFSMAVLPFKVDRTSSAPLAPKDYGDVVKERELKVSKIKTLIQEANLQEEQEKALHVAIQGYFREYLVSSGNIKPMTEIVKMIDFGTSRNREEEN